MPLPNFFAVERSGYTKISDLFTDVMKDMIEHGFELIKKDGQTVGASNGYPMTSWKTEVVTGGAGWQVGDKLYIVDGDRPTFGGSPRPFPYVEVKTVTSVGTTVNSITSVTDVLASYDAPIWTNDIDPGNAHPISPVTLYRDAEGTIATNVTINITNTAVSYSTLGTVQNAPERFSFTLEATGDVDPLNESRPAPTYPFVEEVKRQPWRVQFVVTDEQKVSGSVATSLQMDYDETVGRVTISKITDDFGKIIDNVGAIGAAQPDGIFSDVDINQGLYNRKIRVADQEKTFPLTYILSITNRGFFLGIYEGSWSTTRAANTAYSNYFNWVLVQRPVDRGTGVTLTRGKAPVFHINGVNYKYYKAIVREADILHPTSGPTPIPGSGNLEVLPSATITLTPTQWTANGYFSNVSQTFSSFTTELESGSTIYSNAGAYIGVVKSVDSDTKITFIQRPLVSQMGNVANITGRDGNGNVIYGTPKFITSNVGTNWFYSPPNIQAYRVFADTHSPDSHAIFNSVEQISLTEDKTYLLSFPHNLTTPRFRYTEELDMIGTTSADVVMSGQDIQFTTYGEWGPRTYRALPANNQLNTGLRLAVLWRPVGPKWLAPVEGYLQDIEPGDAIDIDLLAEEAPVSAGDTPRSDPLFRIERGTLPKGLVFYPNGKIAGTVEIAEYTEPTMIKFTIAAYHLEEGDQAGYALRDFWFVYKV